MTEQKAPFRLMDIYTDDKERPDYQERLRTLVRQIPGYAVEEHDQRTSGADSFTLVGPSGERIGIAHLAGDQYAKTNRVDPQDESNQFVPLYEDKLTKLHWAITAMEGPLYSRIIAAPEDLLPPGAPLPE